MDFTTRHIGPDLKQQEIMLATLGFDNLEDFINNVIPKDLLSNTGTVGVEGLSEYQAAQKLFTIARKNKLYKNYIGLGYFETITPPVIKRNVFENPGWYTAYTPYQAEISQGRLEALLNFQQMVMDLTGFALANASLLDEATAAAEAMLMAYRLDSADGNKFFVAKNTYAQVLEVIKTRAEYAGIEVIIDDIAKCEANKYFGVYIQNPDVYGQIRDYSQVISNLKVASPNLIVVMGCDILSLVLFKSPNAQGADIAVGSTQRFGIPLGFGGPSAAYLATKDEYKRSIPGRIIGVSVDSRKNPALRMALQTREQHIRREKATSNICTSQVLLANMAGFYAVYHGPAGLKEIAGKIHHLALVLADNLIKLGFKLTHNGLIFDTVSITGPNIHEIYKKLKEAGYLTCIINNILSISLGEMTDISDISNIISTIGGREVDLGQVNTPRITTDLSKYADFFRQDKILTHPVFNSYHSETKMMRYLKSLENKDISLVHSMIALGSCTMKLNAASELEPISWPHLANIHPFAPYDSVNGYLEFIDSFKQQLKAITGFEDISLQPNSGAQGEYAGLLAIRRYQKSIGQGKRNICLIPKSAHGTNPATAHMMDMQVVIVNCDAGGNVDIDHLQKLAYEHRDDLSCLMITYPSTHGVFEAGIKQICKIVHDHGGQVYMDGANLNALVGLVKPAELGADVSHINLHKTFAIPHGGGGPGMGPIGVKEHLAKFLPEHVYFANCRTRTEMPLTDTLTHAVSASPYGSASILPISWMYTTMLGELGLRRSTTVAILNANYIANKLKHAYPILYTAANGTVAHECILDLRPIKAQTGISEVDIAKRLMDYGFHSPTMSFPVPGTLMIEPTESEAQDELDRFIDAMLKISAEIEAVKSGLVDKLNNVLKNAPHTLADVMAWDKPYSIEEACFPLDYLKKSKIFPSVNRIDDAHGDRNFICSCPDFSS
ncbi:MAG: gcvP [Burkholderiales bacterium]|jgi:glycine dehydrogenase|nr:gcvP [Burkholderiales bacterium]